MTYLVLCAVFMVIAALSAALLRRDRRCAATETGGASPRTSLGARPRTSLGARPRTSLAALAIAAAALMVLTALFDNVMIAAGLFAYDDTHISGIRIGAAPIEDFAYPLAAVILLPAIWARLLTPWQRRSRRDR
ncbi:lycopene cyclase domain-containing protein [Microbacterium paludicola]|uniref:Lycopene cyclase domain-containing protein n=1 Tax=Microbacterium paludicola TaxID=300019 RepID=A0A4Y9FSE4_9MICO|nr:lycopene cyclase domain-containing protein [Microbacterium paludicola]MBF0817392.1 lycopene cyclase domain-containing protein [Microbacterium paludicola]TFU31443.1 lycopene cyclase domain-containing protein [Microbacterium paludicola]